MMMISKSRVYAECRVSVDACAGRKEVVNLSASCSIAKHSFA